MTSVTKKFFSLFWTNTVCQNIFSTHKEQILEKREVDVGTEKRTYYLQKIVISNDQVKKTDQQLVVTRIENKRVDLTDNLENKAAKYFDDAKFQAFIDTRFGKAIEKIENKLSSGTFSQVRFGFELLNSLSNEAKLITFLKKYHLIPEHINSFSQIEEIFQKTVSNLITKDAIIDLLDSVDKISEIYNTEIYQNLVESNQFYTNVMYDTESYKSRIQLFDFLYEAGVLESGVYKTYYECYNCDDNSFKTIATIKAKPSKIALKCPICNKETAYLSPYRINDSVFEKITHKDGLVMFAVTYLLEENGYNCTQNFHIPTDIELDLVAFKDGRNAVIFELKMYKTDTPEHTQKSNLNKAVSQAIKTRSRISDLNNQFVTADFYIVTNYKNLELIKETREEHREELREKKIKLLSLGELYEKISNS
jgi:hypothetical protein